MDQASVLPAASCARNPAALRTSSSCSRSADQSQTAAPPPARSAPQSEPHPYLQIEIHVLHPSPSAESRAKAICCRIFTPAQPEGPAASVRDYCSGAYSTRAAAATPGAFAWEGRPILRPALRALTSASFIRPLAHVF